MTPAPFRPLHYTIGATTLRVDYADMTTIPAEVLVSSDDTDLSMRGGVSAALRRAGGPEVEREARAQAPVALGDVVVTTAGRLPARAIFHAAVLDYDQRDLTTTDLIRRVTRRCLELCDQRGLTSLAIPAFATGTAQLAPERSATAIALECSTYLAGPTTLAQVVCVIYPHTDLQYDILTRYYLQVMQLLELNDTVQRVTAALDHVEQVYRDLRRDDAAQSSAAMRERLQAQRRWWEQDVVGREIQAYASGQHLQEYRKELEPELNRVAALTQTEYAREPRLERDVATLNIEIQIDEARRGRTVAELTSTDAFMQIQARARQLRRQYPSHGRP